MSSTNLVVAPFHSYHCFLWIVFILFHCDDIVRGREVVPSFIHQRRRVARTDPSNPLVSLPIASQREIASTTGSQDGGSAEKPVASAASSIGTGTSVLTSLTTTPSVVFTDAVFDKIASRVQEHVRIPMVPTPIVNFCLTRALERMSQDLSPSLLGQVEDVLAAEATTSKQDDVDANELNLLADQIARELTEKGFIDVPVLNALQEYEILSQIFRIVLTVVTTSEDERRVAFIEKTQLVAQDLLSDTPEGRMALVTKLNAIIDLPLLGEEQEARLLQRAVDMCAYTLSTLVPPPLLHSIKGESRDSLAEFKEFLIVKVNEKVDFIGLNEEQEASMIRTMIDLLIESYVDPSATNLLGLKGNEAARAVNNTYYNPRDALERKLVSLQREIDLSRIRYEREQAKLATEMDGLHDRLQALTDAATSTLTEMDDATPSFD